MQSDDRGAPSSVDTTAVQTSAPAIAPASPDSLPKHFSSFCEMWKQNRDHDDRMTAKELEGPELLAETKRLYGVYIERFNRLKKQGDVPAEISDAYDEYTQAFQDANPEVQAAATFEDYTQIYLTRLLSGHKGSILAGYYVNECLPNMESSEEAID